MKKLILLLFIPTYCWSQSTTVVATNVVANQSLTLNKVKISSIQKDTNFIDSFKIPTSLAVANYTNFKFSRKFLADLPFQLVSGGANADTLRITAADDSNDGYMTAADHTLLSSKWSYTGDAISAGKFLGTTNSQPIIFKVNSTEYMRLTSAGLGIGNTPSYPLDVTGVIHGSSDANINGLTIGQGGGGSQNTALGVNAGAGAGTQNVHVGWSAGTNVTGILNTYIGYGTALSTTTGGANVAIGANAFSNHTIGNYNIAIGYLSMGSSNSGVDNVAVGKASLAGAGAFNDNTAIGYTALNITTGDNNTAVGSAAGLFNTSGANNSMLGFKSLYSNTTGSNNTGIGYYAGYYNTTASNQTFFGAFDNGSYINDTSKSAMILFHNTTVASQRIKVNGVLDINQNINLRNLTTSLPLKLDANKNIISQAIALGSSEISGIAFGINGGTGVANTGKTITLGGNLITTGAFNTTLAVTGSNTVTFPNAAITVARNDAAQNFTGVQTFLTSISTPQVLISSQAVATVIDNDSLAVMHNGIVKRLSAADWIANYGLASGNFINSGGNTSLLSDINISDFNVGFGVPEPKSQVHTTSFAAGYKKVEVNEYNITATDHVISVNNTTHDWDIYLPDASTCPGRIYVIKRFNDNSTGVITIYSLGGNIQSIADGTFGSTYAMNLLWGDRDSNAHITFQSNGTDWEAIGR